MRPKQVAQNMTMTTRSFPKKSPEGEQTVNNEIIYYF